jgi:hypothetical protein
MLTFFVTYGQGEQYIHKDTVYNSFNGKLSLERNIICDEDDVIDTLLEKNGLMILFSESCQKNFLYDDNRRKLFDLGRFSSSMGIPPNEVSFITIGNNEIGILYRSIYCKFGFCDEYYLFYLYPINENFVVTLCCFIEISTTKMGKEKNNAI